MPTITITIQTPTGVTSGITVQCASLQEWGGQFISGVDALTATAFQGTLSIANLINTTQNGDLIVMGLGLENPTNFTTVPSANSPFTLGTSAQEGPIASPFVWVSDAYDIQPIAGSNSIGFTWTGGSGYGSAMIATAFKVVSGTPTLLQHTSIQLGSGPSVAWTGVVVNPLSLLVLDIITTSVFSGGSYYSGVVSVSDTNGGIWVENPESNNSMGNVAGTGTLSQWYCVAVPSAVTVTSISPSMGTYLGGTPVTITGTGFYLGATVTVGPYTLLPGWTVVNSTTITGVTEQNGSPATAGLANVVVTNSIGGTAGTLVNGYTYLPTVPVVTTQVPNSITLTGADLNGTIVSTGGVPDTIVGFVYGLTSQPLSGNVLPTATGYTSYVETVGSPPYGVGPFDIVVSGLLPNTDYFYRSFAFNGTGIDEGYAYGNEVGFTSGTQFVPELISFGMGR